MWKGEAPKLHFELHGNNLGTQKKLKKNNSKQIPEVGNKNQDLPGGKGHITQPNKIILLVK